MHRCYVRVSRPSVLTGHSPCAQAASSCDTCSCRMLGPYLRRTVQCQAPKMVRMNISKAASTPVCTASLPVFVLPQY